MRVFAEYSVLVVLKYILCWVILVITYYFKFKDLLLNIRTRN